MNKQPLTYMSIDPGSNCLGVAIWEIDAQTLDVVRTNAFTIFAPMSRYYRKGHSERHGDRFCRYEALESELFDLFLEYRPFMVVCESPFFSPRTPTAFAVLTELVFLIQKTLWTFNNHIPFYKVDPPSAKKCIGAKGSAKGRTDNKTPVYDSVVRMKDEFKMTTPPEELDEHSIDAMAVGYFGLCHYVKDNK